MKAVIKLFGLCLLLSTLTAKVAVALQYHEEPWGTLADGRAIKRYTLTNAHGASVSFMPLGAAILSLTVPDRNGQLADVVLGYDKPSDYDTNNSPMFGLTIVRREADLESIFLQWPPPHSPCVVRVW